MVTVVFTFCGAKFWYFGPIFTGFCHVFTIPMMNTQSQTTPSVGTERIPPDLNDVSRESQSPPLPTPTQPADHVEDTNCRKLSDQYRTGWKMILIRSITINAWSHVSRLARFRTILSESSKNDQKTANRALVHASGNV